MANSAGPNFTPPTLNVKGMPLVPSEQPINPDVLKQHIEQLRTKHADNIQDAAQTTRVINEARAEQANALDSHITELAQTRAELGATDAPGPVVNANLIAGVLINVILIAGATLTDAQIDAIKVVVVLVVNLIGFIGAAYYARRKVTPVQAADRRAAA